ncbi:MAG: hypothetical protein BHV75_06285 [Bacteroides oleiciplenus]|nr:MAG: hypothetical protein BHV75_06285 [Bacteroides oleiciplenus]
MILNEKQTAIKIDNGSFVTCEGDIHYYLIQEAQRHEVPLKVLDALIDNKKVIRVIKKDTLENIPLGISLSDDTCLIRGHETAPVYLYSNYVKSHIRSLNDFNLTGFKRGAIKNICQEGIDKIRPVRDFIIEKNKEVFINNGDIPSDFADYTDYGIREDFVYESDGEVMKQCSILLPEEKEDKKYPVLYLYHGLGENTEWLDLNKGRIRKIMGYMVSKKMIPEMVVVIPQIMSPDSTCEEKKVCDFHYFHKHLTHLMDYVNTTYSNVVSVKKENNAIAGISLGGTTALYNGYLFKERFKYVAGISPNYELLTSKERGIFNGWIAKPEDFVLGTGDGGFAFIGNGTADTGTGSHPRYYSNVLNENGIDNLFTLLPNGGHNWEAFRKLFYIFMSYDFFRKRVD